MSLRGQNDVVPCWIQYFLLCISEASYSRLLQLHVIYAYSSFHASCIYFTSSHFMLHDFFLVYCSQLATLLATHQFRSNLCLYYDIYSHCKWNLTIYIYFPDLIYKTNILDETPPICETSHYTCISCLIIVVKPKHSKVNKSCTMSV